MDFFEYSIGIILGFQFTIGIGKKARIVCHSSKEILKNLASNPF